MRSLEHPLIVLYCMLSLLFSSLAYCRVQSPAAENSTQQSTHRIVTLAPHLTEWVYALQAQDTLVGVSAYSDYPSEANNKLVVADANGINFKALLELKPDLILAWEGGNKSQELARLESLGFTLFRSSPQQLDDIGSEINRLGQLLGKSDRATQITSQFSAELNQLRNLYQSSVSLPVFFYLWTKPLMSIGNNAWANKVLAVCNAHTIFDDSPNDYPEVRMAEVLIRQPKVLISTINTPIDEQEYFWQSHRDVLVAPIIQVDGTVINRFTPRITGEIEVLCDSLHNAQPLD